MKKFTVENAKFKAKELYFKGKQKAKEAFRFGLEHPVLVTTAAGLLGTAMHKGSRMYISHKEDVRRNTDFYNPRTGSHVKIRRKLDPKEFTYAERRFKNGDDWSEIFNDMGLLK